MPIYKKVDELTPQDFAVHPVWEFAPEMEGVEGFDETVVKPVTAALPVSNLDNRVVGTGVTLANGTRVPAMFGTVDFEKVLRNPKLLGLSLFWNGSWRGFFPPHDFGEPGYLYKILDPDRLNEDGNLEIVNVAHVLNGPPDFSDSDVEVRWFDRDTKVGVLIGNILWAYFDVEAGRSVSGRYPSRPLPWPELTPEH